MNNPFEARTMPLSGPAKDLMPVTPSDTVDMAEVAVSLYVETGGTVAFISESGDTRSAAVPDFSILPVGIRRVLATGTTATGIHALLVS